MTSAAIEQLKVQAQQGDGEACFDLYKEYKNGIHVQENESIAMDWLEKALDCNHPMAQLIMGLSLLNAGQIDDAIDYLILSSTNQNPEAMNVLGQLYLGNVDKVQMDIVDQDKGIEFLIKAGLAGNLSAQIMLGKCFYLGKWVPQDRLLAKHWLGKAIDQGSPEALQLYDEACRIPTELN